MAKGKMRAPSSEGFSSVLQKFVPPEAYPGTFFVNKLPKEWRPKLMPRELWSIEDRIHSTAFISVELDNFDVFGRLDRLSIDGARALARPMGAWIGELPNVQLWDQIGEFDRNLGHWHFLYRDQKITGSLDIFIIPKTRRTSILVASITEHVSFR